MIVRLTGTLVEVLPTHVVLDVNGVGYELGVSANTAASLPPTGEAGVTLLTRLIVREDAMELYGFSTREERALFDRLVGRSSTASSRSRELARSSRCPCSPRSSRRSWPRSSQRRTWDA